MFVIASTLAACKTSIKIAGLPFVGDIKYTLDATCPSSVDCIGVNESIANKMSDDIHKSVMTILEEMKKMLSTVFNIKADAKIATCAGGPTAETCKVVCKTDCKKRDDDNNVKVKISLKAGGISVNVDNIDISYPIMYACPKGKALYKMGLAWWAILLIVLAVIIVVAIIITVCVCLCKKNKHGNVATQRGQVMTTVK